MPPRLELASGVIACLQVGLKSLAGTEPVEAGPTFDMVLSSLRGEGANNPVARCSSHWG